MLYLLYKFLIFSFSSIIKYTFNFILVEEYFPEYFDSLLQYKNQISNEFLTYKYLNFKAYMSGVVVQHYVEYLSGQ